VRPLARSRLLLCAAPAYLEAHGTPRTPEDLEHHRFLPIMHPLLRAELLLRREGEKRLVHITPVMRSNSNRVLREACVAGAGILLITTINSWGEIVAGRLTTVLEDWHTVDLGLYAMFPHRRHLAAKVRAFVDFLAERLGGDATRDPWWERIVRRAAPLRSSRSRSAGRARRDLSHPVNNPFPRRLFFSGAARTIVLRVAAHFVLHTFDERSTP
jgi:hypothetical protein